MTDSVDSWTIRLPTTSKTTSWFASVCRPTKLTSGCPSGLQRPRRNSTFWSHGSHARRSTRLSRDQLRRQTITGPTMPLELSSDASWVSPSLESCQLRTSTWDAGSPMHTWSSSCRVELAEVWDIRDQLFSTIIDSMRELCLTIQTCSGGTWPVCCHATHQSQTLTESGELDRRQSSTSTTVLATGTEWECRDTLHGMVPWTSQSCLTLSTRAQTSSTVPSRETPTLRHSSSETGSCRKLQATTSFG